MRHIVINKSLAPSKVYQRYIRLVAFAQWELAGRSDFRVLAYLCMVQDGGIVNLTSTLRKEICEEIGLTQQNFSMIFSKLIKLGIVEKNDDTKIVTLNQVLRHQKVFSSDAKVTINLKSLPLV